MRIIQQRTGWGWLWQLVELGLVVGLLWWWGLLASWLWCPVGWALASVFTRPVLWTGFLVVGGWQLGQVLPWEWQRYLLGVAGLVLVEVYSHDGRVAGWWAREPERVRYVWLGPWQARQQAEGRERR